MNQLNTYRMYLTQYSSVYQYRPPPSPHTHIIGKHIFIVHSGPSEAEATTRRDDDNGTEHLHKHPTLLPSILALPHPKTNMKL